MTAATKNLILTVSLTMACGVVGACGVIGFSGMPWPLWLKILASVAIASINCSSAYLISKYQIQVFRDQPPREMPTAGLPGLNSPYGHADYAGNELYRFNLSSPVESQAARGARLWFWNPQMREWREATMGESSMVATVAESVRTGAPTTNTVQVTTTESIAPPVGFRVTSEDYRAQREEEIRQIGNLAPGEWFTISQPIFGPMEMNDAEAAAKKSIPSGRRAIRGGDA